MRKNRFCPLLLLVPLALLTVPAYPGEPGATAAPPAADGFVPVAIWELHRDGFPTIKHAWVAGSEKMLRVSFDDGISWYGFRPVFTDATRGLLALKVAVREELGRGEVAWRDKAGLTLTAGLEAKITLPATATTPAGEVTARLLEVKEVSPSELKQAAPELDATAAQPDGGVLPMAPPHGGLGSCCVSCQGMRVCDCSVCIEACQTSCCLGGCYCLSC